MIARLEPKSSLLLVIDVQEKLAAAMPKEAFDALVHNTCILLESARILGVSVIATEQYPKGLGKTVAPIAEKLAALSVTPIEKLDFSALDDANVARAIAAARPRAVIVVGMESHVCVLQSARDLAARHTTYVAADAVASRSEKNREAGLALAQRSGVIATTAEIVVFDWLRRAEGDAFKAISKLVR